MTEFLSQTGFIPFKADLSGSWAEFNLGIDMSMTENFKLYANAGYQIGWDTDATAYSGKIGLRFSW